MGYMVGRKLVQYWIAVVAYQAATSLKVGRYLIK